jgi:enoyl-CoA hydratase
MRWPDFAEGVRATLVDRDRPPRWTPDTFAGVTEKIVARFEEGARESDPVLGLT